MERLVQVCPFCGQEWGEVASRCRGRAAQMDRGSMMTESEWADWQESGIPPHAIGIDGSGDRDLAPDQSRVESAYRRGVVQAFSYAMSLTKRQLRQALEIAKEYRWGKFCDKAEPLLLHAIDYRIRSAMYGTAPEGDRGPRR